MPKLSDWLLGHAGYQRLEDSYFPDVYRMAYYTGGVEFLSIINEYGAGTLTFNCAPEKYYKMGERPVQITNGQIISNPTLFPAKPLISITGSGEGTIYFNNNKLDISNIGRTMDIDIRDHMATHTSGSVVENRNSRITGLFENMTLKGKTTIRWTGGIESLTLIPRWWTI